MNLSTDIAEPIAVPKGAPDVLLQKGVSGGERKEDGPKWIPQPARDGWHWFSTKAKHLRHAAIAASPAVIVNQSPTIFAAVHTIAEVFMLKANGTDLISPENSGKPLHYLIDPPKNIYKSVLSDAKLDLSFKNLVRPAFYRDALKSHFNLKQATKIDLTHGRLINHFQARATLIGMTAWALGMVLPNTKDTPEETEKMSTLATNNPLGYVGERLRQAVWIPEWWQHKRQMIGLGVFLAGACSILGGWRNVSSPRGRLQSYFFNWQYVATGLMSLCSSFPMMFAVDNDKGYSQSASIHVLRFFFIPGSIIKKFAKQDIRAWWYTAGAAGFQLENYIAMLIGGAEKRPDGTIVDHKAIREAAKQKAKAEYVEHQIAKIKRTYADGVIDAGGNPVTSPRPTITQASAPERAMPERVAQVAEQEKNTVAV